MIQLDDKWLRIFGIPLITLVPTFILANSIENHVSYWVIYTYMVLETGILWELNRYIIFKAQIKFPKLNQYVQRIQFELLGCFVLAIVLCMFYSYLNAYIFFPNNKFDLINHFSNVLMGFIFVFSILGIYESLYFYKKWREQMKETAKLKKENVEQQLEVLKSQINPHFLFNSLNTLSSLITVDSQRASQFLDELAVVYRYLLRNNENEICTLSDELKFIKAYFHLIETRHGEAVKMYLDIPATYYGSKIPSLTLQLLVENAVKHNIILKSKPLYIRISIEGDYLIVENNLQKKTSVTSSKVGLNNIIEKYELLMQATVMIIQDEKNFIVKVPLIFS